MKTFWQHTNGLIYVIESDTFGHITAATGPIEPVGVRDPSEYKCGPGIVAWARQSIAERKLCRVNLAINRDGPPAGIGRPNCEEPKPASPPGPALKPRAPRAGQAPPQAIVPVPSRPAEPPSDARQQEIAARRRFSWSSTFHL